MKPAVTIAPAAPAEFLRISRAIEYLADEDEPTRRPFRYLSLAQAYRMSEWDEPGEGIEVFSMLRESNKKPKDYLTRFFDTGNENNGPAL